MKTNLVSINCRAISFHVLVFLFSCILFISYRNHFNNGFQFDDYHTIVNNACIHDVSNALDMITKIECYGTNPDNRTYNPFLVILNAFDVWIAGGLDPYVFHRSIFISYIFLWIFLYYFFKKIIDCSFHDKWNDFFSLFFSFFFMQHASNAETINYIIMRSDSFSTLMIVLSFVLYVNEKTRKYKIYYISFLLGMATKATGFVFAPLFFFYVLLFEEQMPLWGPFFAKNLKKTMTLVRKSAPLLVFGIIIFSLERVVFKQGNPLPSSGPAWSRSWAYFVTQWQVIAHYLGNFILPLDLSVDTDFAIVANFWQRKVLLSLGLLLALAAVGVVASGKKETRPVSFGIIWFFLALAPTSSFIPFGQIANDHRTFFPYIGLVLASGCWISLKVMQVRDAVPSSRAAIPSIAGLFFLAVGLHAYGTHKRNEVWGSSESLWKDAVAKAPGNGRVQMNYGLALMEKGQLDGARIHFEKALELMPFWSYAHINMGILKNETGKSDEAETHFRKAMAYHPMNPASYYYYAIFLDEKFRRKEALAVLEKGIEISPNYAGFASLRKKMTASSENLQAGTEGLSLAEHERQLEENPRAGGYLDLSLRYYKAGNFKRCIAACVKALELQPDHAVAYNNICSAYNAMTEWDHAIAACEKALKINPSYQRAKNNLRVALAGQAEKKGGGPEALTEQDN